MSPEFGGGRYDHHRKADTVYGEFRGVTQRCVPVAINVLHEKMGEESFLALVLVRPCRRTCYRKPAAERSKGIHWLTFNTQAGCGSNSSGRSGSSIDSPAFAALNFSGAVDPSKVTDLAPVTSLS